MGFPSGNECHKSTPLFLPGRWPQSRKAPKVLRPSSEVLINVSALSDAFSRGSEIVRGVLLLRHRVRFAVFNPKSHRVGTLRLALFVYHNNFAVCVKLLTLFVIRDMVRSKREEVVGYKNWGTQSRRISAASVNVRWFRYNAKVHRCAVHVTTVNGISSSISNKELKC